MKNSKPLSIFGINDGHGSSVCYLKDGVILAAMEEERFSRIKGDAGFPTLALEKLFGEFGKEISKPNYIAVASRDHSFAFHATKRYPRFTIRDFLKEERRYWIPTLSEGKKIDYRSVMSEYFDYSLSRYPLQSIENNPTTEELRRVRQSYIAAQFGLAEENVCFIDHHSCHAHHAYFSSPFRSETLIVTADGFGDGTNATIHVENSNGKLDCLYRTAQANIGRIYQLITLLLGMKPAEHEYKVMGLAAYAKEHQIAELLPIFEETYYVDGLEFKIDNPISNHYQYFKERLEGYRFDAISGALQRYAENIFTKWISNWVEHTGFKKVVFSGGVALNIKLSKKIAELPNVSSLFVCLAGGDESLSIGAAQALYSEHGTPKSLAPISSPYLSSRFSQQSITQAIKTDFVKENFTVVQDVTPSDLAKILADGHILGLMQGSMEFGPRALGNRSLLTDPRDIGVVQKLNNAIKNRDFWMPFTPSILEERLERYVVNPKKLLAPYMTMAFDSTELARRDLPAAIHPCDNTLRAQSVSKSVSPFYHELISKFEELTGVAALLNTSFNIHGKPIVEKPIDVINEILVHDFVKLDYICFENVLLKRKSLNS